ncbi:MAG: 2-oxo acid dehydrogenase subunit E2 [Oscillospiraceae bacterium]|nr:2-oxo acid dehydrogenase subunit E2 [Oscillospiraceae bacterium]
MSEAYKRRLGDRRDGRWIRDVSGLTTLMMHIMTNRTDAEVYLNEKIDVTDLLKYLEQKNAMHPDYKTTVFHCFVLAIGRMIRERPKMNRFVQGRRMYERNEISLSFMAKRRFTDHAEEAMMFFVPKDEDTIDSFSYEIAGKVREMRKSEHSTGGMDSTIDAFAKIPRLLLMFVTRVIRWLDFWGVNPKALTDGDTNYSTVLLSNLGSIKGPAVYHHLNNYGTNSIMVTVGTIHKEELVMPDGHKELRDVVEIGATLDERIADGFYFVRSLKLVEYLFAHPELLDRPFGESSGFDFK